MIKPADNLIDIEGAYQAGYFRKDWCGFHWQQDPYKKSKPTKESNRTRTRDQRGIDEDPHYTPEPTIAPEPEQWRIFRQLWYIWTQIICRIPQLIEAWEDSAKRDKTFNLKAETTGLQTFDYFVKCNMPRILEGKEFWALPGRGIFALPPAD